MASIKKNFMYQTMWQIMSMILPLVTSPILARALGAEGLGTYSYVTSVSGFFVLAANLGMYTYGMRAIAAVRDDQEALSRTFWEIWKLHSLSAVTAGMAYLGSAIFLSEYRLYFLITFVEFVGSVININWLFFGVEDFKKITIRDMVVKLTTFILIVLFVRTESDLIVYFIINAAGSLVSNLIYWVMYQKYVMKIKVSFRDSFRHWKAMLILFVPILLESLYAGMDRVMLGIMCPKSEVGYYTNADKALIAKALIYSVMTVLMPRMSNLLAKKDYGTFHVLMKKSTGIIMLLVSAFAFGTAAVAREFSVVFWGEDFIPSADLIVILAMAMPAVVLSREIREQYLIPGGREREFLLSTAAGACSNLVINAVLIPHYGAVGATVATLLSNYIVLAVQMFAVRRKLPMLRYIHGNEIYLFFGIVMFCAVRYMGSFLGIHLYSLLIEIAVGTVVFAALCMAYWILTGNREYLELIKTVRRKKV